MLKGSAKEFVAKYVPQGENGLEKSGITKDLTKALAELGFLNMCLPAEAGGAALDEEPYLAVLGEFSRYEPSIAMEILLVNSVAANILSKFEDGLQALAKTGAGELGFIVSPPSPYARNSFHSDHVSLDAELSVVVGNGTDYMIVSDLDGRTLYVKDEIRFKRFPRPLGFRALQWGKAEAKKSQYESVGKGMLEEAFSSGMSRAVSSIALGIAETSIDKTIEYTKVRKVFNTPLKDFGPVAGAISRMKVEAELLRSGLAAQSVDAEILRHKALDLALDASRTAVQYHGGYGYFEAFGIEKLYRDSMVMKMMFGGVDQDLLLYRKTFRSDSGII